MAFKISVNELDISGAFLIGSVHNATIYITATGSTNWPRGAIGIIFVNLNEIIILEKEYNWTINPLHDKNKLFDEIDRTKFKEHCEDAMLMQREKLFEDPMMGYLFISNLFIAGYSLHRHINWASYMISEIGKMLQQHKVQLRLLK